MSTDHNRPDDSSQGTSNRLSVRFFGHSSMTFAGQGDGDSLIERTTSELRRLRPDVDWRCDSDLLYISPGMANHVRRRIEARLTT